MFLNDNPVWRLRKDACHVIIPDLTDFEGVPRKIKIKKIIITAAVIGILSALGITAAAIKTSWYAKKQAFFVRREQIVESSKKSAAAFSGAMSQKSRLQRDMKSSSNTPVDPSKSVPSAPFAASDSMFSFDKTMPARRQFVSQGKSATATYLTTETIFDQNHADAYGTYDMYKSADGMSFYTFMHGTDKLCAVLKNVRPHNVPQQNAISVEEAENDALLYASKDLGDMSAYTLESCDYDPLSGYYGVTYVKKLSGLNTDDEISVWVTYNGQPFQYSAFRMGRYDKFATAAIDKTKLTDALSAAVSKAGIAAGYKLNKTYLTLGDDGKLQAVDDITYNSATAGQKTGASARTLIKVPVD